MTFNLPDESYSRNVYCALNWIHTIYYYHWVDTSANGQLVPECIILPSVSAWFIRYIYYILFIFIIVNMIYQNKGQYLSNLSRVLLQSFTTGFYYRVLLQGFTTEFYYRVLLQGFTTGFYYRVTGFTTEFYYPVRSH